jgi:hypothetical protein
MKAPLWSNDTSFSRNTIPPYIIRAKSSPIYQKFHSLGLCIHVMMWVIQPPLITISVERKTLLGPVGLSVYFPKHLFSSSMNVIRSQSVCAYSKRDVTMQGIIFLYFKGELNCFTLKRNRRLSRTYLTFKKALYFCMSFEKKIRERRLQNI